MKFLTKELTVVCLALGGSSVSAAAMAFPANAVTASPVNNFTTVLPPNNLDTEDNPEMSSGITSRQFDMLIDQAERYYEPIIAMHGGNLVVNRKWEAHTVNASAEQIDGNWYVNMYGGLARRPEITPDGFALVVCHEIGHHLAGFPFVSKWAANEGESDYFAVQSCLRELWQNQKSANAAAKQTINESEASLCNEVWQRQSDRDLCYRAMGAGRSLAELVARTEKTSVSFDMPDSTTVSVTNDGHPDAQCRLARPRDVVLNPA